jgi:transcriptional regulator with XRE-family HTH domain
MICLQLNADPPIAPPDEPDSELGRVIRQLRERRGLSQACLAERAQIDPATLQQLEDGVIDPPWATVEALARGLGVTMGSLADAVAARPDDVSGR